MAGSAPSDYPPTSEFYVADGGPGMLPAGPSRQLGTASAFSLHAACYACTPSPHLHRAPANCAPTATWCKPHAPCAAERTAGQYLALRMM
eukprot:gene6108-5961_t